MTGPRGFAGPPGTEEAAPFIAVEGVQVVYGAGGTEAVQALSDIHLAVPEGAFVSLVGPSGCGKSTLLKAVGDLLAPTSGRITIGGTPAAELRRQGRIGTVFQAPNLMPWLRIEDNVRLLYRIVAEKAPRAGLVEPDVPALLKLVGLDGFGGKRPAQLSGGMQSRAALARALALDPTVLLMDEPFAALDEITRDRMGIELMRIHAQFRKTVLFVTHSLAEAAFLSDAIVLMTPRPGRIARIIPVPLPRPRVPEMRLTDEFAALVAELNRDLYRMMA
ncbi:ATP-binding cassette domain-containing protein [Roseomonas stagni]|uniref:ATP-binding cassette domain-containing protein n=1 Tax=Falsiroseomonas algicola TaxID=2716930 RepID=A0A6M1LHU3_9PROT|nr:ATP-binding cassette domain-containing protein [Falsiroseomonas algicola]